MLRHRLLRLGMILGLFLLLKGSFVTFVAPYYGLRVNRTPSLPQTLFLSVPLREIGRDIYVSFRRPESALPLVKVIKGLPGDPLEIVDGSLFVAGQDCGLALTVSKSGRFYNPNQQKIIPPGYIYAYSPHPDSFDSRYEEFSEEFGLVKIEDLTEELWPLF